MTDNNIGHNSGSVDHGHLKSFVERVERLHEERKAIADDIKDIYSEAKGTGFDTKVLKHIVALRSKDPNAIREFEELVDCYKSALGML